VLEAVSEFLVQGGIEIVARARDGEEALEKIEQRKPDVALVDVRMPKLDGIELARQAHRLSPDTGIVLYTGYGDRAQLTEALDAGVRGFVLKEAPMDDLLRALHSVAAGGTYVDPVLAGALASSVSDGIRCVPGDQVRDRALRGPGRPRAPGDRGRSRGGGSRN